MTTEGLAGMLQGYFVFDLILLPVAVLMIWLLHKYTTGAERVRTAWWWQLLLGMIVASGSLLLVFCIISLAGGFSPAAAGYRQFSYSNSAASAEFTLFLAKFFLAQSLWEELLYRVIGTGSFAWLLYWLSGMVFTPSKNENSPGSNWRRWLISGTCANILVSIAFAWAHTSNLNVSFLGLVNVLFAGVVIGQLFILHANFLSPWAFHFCWNFGLSLLGLPISGYAISPQITAVGATGAVPGILSGGSFGPEGSVVATVVLIGAGAGLIYAGFRHNAGTQTGQQAGESAGDST